MKKNQSGFSTVEVIIVVVLVGLLAGIGWLVYQHQHRTPANISTSQTPPAKSYALSPAPAASTNAPKNVGYVTIKEWGVKIKVAEATKITYTFHGAGGTFLNSTFESYVAPAIKPEALKDKTCELGLQFYRSTDKQSFTDKKIGKFYYWIAGGPGPCSDDPAHNPDDILKASIDSDLQANNFEAL